MFFQFGQISLRTPVLFHAAMERPSRPGIVWTNKLGQWYLPSCVTERPMEHKPVLSRIVHVNCWSYWIGEEKLHKYGFLVFQIGLILRMNPAVEKERFWVTESVCRHQMQLWLMIPYVLETIRNSITVNPQVFPYGLLYIQVLKVVSRSNWCHIVH